MNRSLLPIFSLIFLTAGASFARLSAEMSKSSLQQLAKQSPQAQASSSRLTADWRLSLSGNQANDEQTQSKYVNLALDLRSKYLLTSHLHLDIQPTIRLVTGQSQSIDGANPLENKILLNQAALHWNPFKFSTLSAGALNQNYIHSNLLIDSIAFPAARSTLQFKNGATESLLALETAIPTSTSLSTNTKELEATPSLNSAAASIKWSRLNFTWKNKLGYYLFNNLPSSVAQQSMLLGNSVRNIADARYTFNYLHQGMEATSDVIISLNPGIDLLATIDYLNNDKVDSEIGQASKYLVGATLHFTGDIDWTVRGGMYFIAPEAAVAYFTARNFQTNRRGYLIENFVTIKPESFRIGLQYCESEVMFRNPIQSREKSILIKLETFYANI